MNTAMWPHILVVDDPRIVRATIVRNCYDVREEDEGARRYRAPHRGQERLKYF